MVPDSHDDAPAPEAAAEGAASQSFLALYESTAPLLYAWAGTRIRPALRAQVDAEDLVQEICYRAFERFGHFDERQGSFRRWVFGIANNVLKETLLSLRRRPPPEPGLSGASRSRIEKLPDAATTISRRVARDENLQRIIDALNELEEDDRKLFIYRSLEGLSHPEVAELMGLSTSAAEKRWQRLRPTLEGIINIESLLVR